MKLTFAHFFCLLIIAFGFGYYGYVTYMAFAHAAIPAMVTEIKGDVNIWVTAAIMYVIGSTAGSQKKDKTIDDALASIPAGVLPPVATPIEPTEPAKP